MKMARSLMSQIEEKRPGDGNVIGSGWSRLETLPDAVIEQLKKREYWIGHTIGERYRLKSLLGVGGMGQVFVAENLAIGAEVAVKLLKPELIASKLFRQRFQKEAEAIGSINHQNVARLFDLVVGDPTFLVMEYVQGPTLYQLIENEKRLDYHRALRIASRLCWGLHAAHERGIVHRDLKPANIIIASDPEGGDQPKIIDFGLAKLANATVNKDLTRTGQTMGTPAYMAPEQVAGRPVDARADVYSLGCVLYAMLVGKPPFTGDDDVQVMYRQVHEPALAPSAIVPEIPVKVDEVLARALAKDPADRYPDTRALAEALNQAHARRRADRPTSPPPPVRFKYPPLALVASTTLVLGALAGVLIGRRHRSPSAGGAVASGDGSELLIVTSEPPGARVTLDGTALAETTPTVERDVAVGNHTVRITHAGYADTERTIKVAAGQRAVLAVTLPPKSRQIHLRTIPAGAVVFLDNEIVASSTPAEVTVRVDEFYELRLEKQGYEPMTKDLTPDDTAPELELRLDEEKQPMGYVWIDTNGLGDVWVDGRNSGFTAPTPGIRLPIGHHVVELRSSSGDRSRATAINLTKGQSLHISLDMPERK
jgi:serine/threonine-protein kinase